MTTLIDNIRDLVAARPDDVGIVFVDHEGDHARTYRQFFSRSAGYARVLEGMGVQRGDLVILVHEHGEFVMSAFWGALLISAIPSIFPFLSEKLDPARYYSSVRQLVERSGAKVVITSPQSYGPLVEHLAGVKTQITTLEDVPEGDLDHYLNHHHAEPDDTVFLQHSSGSTGLQKGVMLTHGAILRHIESVMVAASLRLDDVIVSWVPLYHDLGLVAKFLLPLAKGIKLVIMSPFHWVRDPQVLLHAIHRHRGTVFSQPNFAYSFLAKRVRDAQIQGIDLSSVRVTLNAGEPVVAETVRLFIERFAPYGLRPEAVGVLYGMAENTLSATITKFPGPPHMDVVDFETLTQNRRAIPAIEGRKSVEMVSCGVPIPDCDVGIVNDQGEFLPERQVGEIVVRSDTLFKGYFHQPDLTDKVFLRDWYLSGDMGYFADGELYVTGRKKDLIIVGGKNIYPQDIEYIANEIDGVHAGRSVAFGVFNKDLGTEDIAIITEVLTEDPEKLGEISRTMRARVAQTLDVTLRYVHLVNSRWMLKTSSGKVARSANRDKFMQEVVGQG